MNHSPDNFGLPVALGPVICVVGARPNFIKMAPILRALEAHVPPVPFMLVHTGQHYGRDMSDRLFEELGLPTPDINLEVGSGSHAAQTGEIMKRFEPVLDACDPSCVLVVGDVNSTLACALVAAKKKIPVVHVEAGLRSNERTMPEEINRLLTDQISDRLYTSERDAEANLTKEGIPEQKICFVGNTMIDSLHFSLEKLRSPQEIVNESMQGCSMSLQPRAYGVVTLHRPSNVDDPEVLRGLLSVLSEVALTLPLVFAIHPRTRSNIELFGYGYLIDKTRLLLVPPLGYLEMLGLLANAKLVLTDSGGLQEESTALGVPCLTLRDNTERPITVTQGTNTLVGGDRVVIRAAVKAVLSGMGKQGNVPELWDGNAAKRIAVDLHQWLMDKKKELPQVNS